MVARNTEEYPELLQVVQCLIAPDVLKLHDDRLLPSRELASILRRVCWNPYQLFELGHCGALHKPATLLLIVANQLFCFSATDSKNNSGIQFCNIYECVILMLT